MSDPKEEQPGLFDAPAKKPVVTPAPAKRKAPVKRKKAPAPAPEPSAAPTAEPAPESGSDVLTVTEITERIHGSLKGFGRVAIEGEVSRVSYPNSGHIYFSLKDDGGALSCAIWKGRRRAALAFELAEGMRVVCRGKLDVFKPRGTYSLMVEKVEQRGIGELLAKLEKLKAELKTRGWFDRRRPVPKLPRCIGVVTSRDTAAFQDFLRTRSLRWPLYPVRFVHTPVQGSGAEHGIASAIRRLGQDPEVDVICVVRGGGSLEDLWCFNELACAEAIWESRVPVVTGVGHETDITLVDLVADHRAHTPTDAARVIPERQQFEERLERAAGYLTGALDRVMEDRKGRLDRAARSRCLAGPGWLLEDRFAAIARAGRRLRLAGDGRLGKARSQLDQMGARLGSLHPGVRIAGLEARLSALAPRLRAASLAPLEDRVRRLDLAQRSLTATSPFAVLARGYSITRRAGDPTPLKGIADIAPGTELETLLDGGRVLSRVEKSEAAADEDLR
jgi:exodeoxyribonuclease VII large subunit